MCADSNLVSVEDLLPPWASGRAKGEFVPNAALPTKDGRRTGNAFLAHWYQKSYGDGTVVDLAKVVTDAGNILNLTINELNELFHPPEFVMLAPLPGAADALKAEAEGSEEGAMRG